MITRRQLLRASGVAAVYSSMLTTTGCTDANHYFDHAGLLRRPLRTSSDSTEQLSELVRCATLAANGHNTQPWRFQLAPDRITITPDWSRRTPAVDPDDHHLWVSLGCATENLVHAATAIGKQAEVEWSPNNIRISLNNEILQRSPLVDAIFQRQCTRAEYDGRPLSLEMMHALEKVGTTNGVELRLITDAKQIEQVLAYVTAGNSAQMRDRAFVAELKHWIRFNDAQAAASGDGLFTAASGNPTSPSWLSSPMFKLFFTEKSENDKYAKQIRSSAGIAILVGERADPSSWFEVGRTYERLALTMTALEIRNSFVNQPVEVPAVRTQFAQWLGAPMRRPDLVLRFGTGALLPYSLRRPVSDVLS